MSISYPNQKKVKIHRETPSKDFLGIKNENWQAASRTLGATALRLYLYLSSNANGYEIALSPAAIEAAIGMPRSTYHDQFRKLINFGYLVETSSNHYDFFETPQPRLVPKPQIEYNFDEAAIVNTSNGNLPHATQDNAKDVFFNSPEVIEINI